MVKLIKFDLQINSQKITNLQELQAAFCVDIIPLYQDGRLSRFLQTRGLHEIAEKIDAIDKNSTELQLIATLGNALGIDGDGFAKELLRKQKEREKIYGGTLGKLEDALGVKIPQEFKEMIEKKLREMRSYVPKIGVFGKIGAGKSSLCNALFGRDICAISDVEACTRDPQKVILSFGNSGGLELIDVPGVGESGERDKEYDELYQNLLPELDLIIWVFRGNDRAAASDEKFYKRLIRRYIDAGKPFIAVINQVDKIEPFREWDLEERKPGAKQATNIEAKRHNIAGLFDLPLSQVLAISANERYGLVELVDAIVHALPNDKKLVVLEKIKAGEEAEIAKKQEEARIKEIKEIKEILEQFKAWFK